MEADFRLSSPVGGDDNVRLPGFRFHPTDEELVGFYLRRKVEKRKISIELIKHADIYKYDPWDLPKCGSGVGENEWYFFCKRGRKYRNSVRPNRVTGSGFWKATGIDRPVYSSAGEGRDCIGLKKSLVFYRGSAGKGTKTDWMMNEFRLPPATYSDKSSMQMEAAPQEAEVWTLCRILKRKVSHRKLSIRDLRDMASNPKEISCNENNRPGSIISFSASPVLRQSDQKKLSFSYSADSINQQLLGCIFNSSPPVASQPPNFAAPSLSRVDMDEFFQYGDWEDIPSMSEHLFASANVFFS